jgi:tetratricopeptide (TPR) repeat protein
VWLLAGEAARALKDFDAALALTSTAPDLFFNRGLAHAILKDRDNAIADYSEAIRLNPRLAIAYHNRGYEYELAGRTELALADYRRALEITPDLKAASDAIARLMRGRM